jgi:zinc transport system ATP-binding protein
MTSAYRTEGAEPILEIRDLNVVRGNETVIRNGNLRVIRGDYVGVVGPNGGGKTTLLQTIFNFIPKESGEVLLFGKRTEQFNEWSRVAYTPQNAIHFDEQFPLTVRELVSLGRVRRSNMLRRLNKEDWNKVDDAMEAMSISHLSDRRIGQLSGGQKQRAFVAKSLSLDPDMLVLDEPTTGLDAGSLESFYKTLSNVQKRRNTTIVVVSHDLSAVFCRMTKMVCVNRRIYETDDLRDADGLLRKVYGEHFEFMKHEHECQGVFDDP